MKEASKPFAWWFVEAFLGSQVKLEPKLHLPPPEPVLPEPEEKKIVKQKSDEKWEWIHG